jgi:hypothetical protein
MIGRVTGKLYQLNGRAAVPADEVRVLRVGMHQVNPKIIPIQKKSRKRTGPRRHRVTHYHTAYTNMAFKMVTIKSSAFAR